MSTKFTNHPRTLINTDELAAFRAKMRREPYSKMLEMSLAAAKLHSDDIDFIADGRLMRTYAEISLAGVEGYSELARQAFSDFESDTKHILSNPMAKGLTRATYLFNLAQTYDFCAAEWDDETCERANSLLFRLMYELSASLGDGGNYHIANNWNGVRAGAIIYAAYACDNENARYLLWESRERLRDHLRANLSNDGWNPEGVGYVTYPWIFMAPAIITARRHGQDYLADIPAARLTYISALFGVVPIEADGYLGIHCDLSDDNADFWTRGTLASAFAIADSEYAPAIKWMFDNLRGCDGDNSWDGGDYGFVNSMLYYPDNIDARNPSELLGLTYTDAGHGLLLTRNRFRDESDIVALCCASSRRPVGTHNGSDTLAVRLIGLGGIFITGSGRTGDPDGQTLLFSDTPADVGQSRDSKLGKMTACSVSHDGSGWAVKRGSCVGTQNHTRIFAVDYSHASGADALVIIADSSDNGSRWRLNTLGINRIECDRLGFTISAPNGASLRVRLYGVDDEALRSPTLGSFERGRAGEAAILLRRQVCNYNSWIEYKVERCVTVVMTLVVPNHTHPEPMLSDGIFRIGAQTVRILRDKVVFGK